MTQESSRDPAAEPVGSDHVPAALTVLLAVSCAIAVANLYYVQPLAGPISRDYGLSVGAAGLLVTVTQLGYALGLILVVPLGDILENRALILVLLSCLVVALIAAALAPNAGVFLIGSFAIGLSASAVQVIVPFAGHLASDQTRGRVVGNVVSGLLFGIMLSRPAASFVAHLASPRTIFALSAGIVTLLVFVLAAKLPRRRPDGLPYGRALASLWPLLRDTAVLHRRGAYQAAMFGCFSLFWTAAPLLLEGPQFQFTQIGIGLFALVGAGGAFISPLAGRWADAGYTRRVTALALASGVVAFLIALVGGWLASWPILMVAALVLDMGTAANLVVGQREIFALGAQARGRLNGLYLALFFVGGAIGSLVAGFALAQGGWTLACAVALAFPLFAIGYFSTDRGA